MAEQRAAPMVDQTACRWAASMVAHLAARTGIYLARSLAENSAASLEMHWAARSVA